MFHKLSECQNNGIKMIFQQDDTPATNSGKTVSEMAEENEIDKVILSPMSPDLDLMGQVWRYVKEMLWAEHLADRTTNFETEIWEFLTTDFVSLYFESIPKKIEAVIATKGRSTVY